MCDAERDHNVGVIVCRTRGQAEEVSHPLAEQTPRHAVPAWPSRARLRRMTHTRFARFLTVFVMLLVLLGGASLAAREAGVAAGVTRKELSVEPFAGDPAKQVVTDYYSFPPGTVLPWHTHPGAHEVSYVLSGEITLEVEGEPVKHLKAGESFYLHPDKVHRGLNEGTEPVELFVVRIKPVDEPLAVNVKPPAAPPGP